jgi:hypothetical protein
MSKIKKWFITKMVRKYQGPAVAWAVGAAASAAVSYLAQGPAWIGKVLQSVLEAASGGQITEVNAATLTIVLTPIFASIAQAVVNAIQTAGIEEIQEANGEKIDGWVGEKTIKSATKNPAKE